MYKNIGINRELARHFDGIIYCKKLQEIHLPIKTVGLVEI